VPVSSIQHEGQSGQVTQMSFDFRQHGYVRPYVSDHRQSGLADGAASQGTLEAGADQEIVVYFDATNLAPGDYTGLITITHNAAGSPSIIPVDLAIPFSAADPRSLPTAFALNGNYPNPFQRRYRDSL